MVEYHDQPDQIKSPIYHSMPLLCLLWVKALVQTSYENKRNAVFFEV